PPTHAQDSDVDLAELRTEYSTNPLGIDETAPRFSWQLHSDRRGVMQTAYQLRVMPSADMPVDVPTWDSGRIESDASVLVPYVGPPLRSRTQYFWQVRVWDDAGEASRWSEPAMFEIGLLEPGDWSAQWIEPGVEEDATRSNPAPMLRREFAVEGGISHARLYATARGLYEVEVNGQRVG